MSFVIGTVNTLVGQVIAVAENGSERLLKLGEAVLNTDTLRTIEGAQFELALSNGQTVAITSAGDWVAANELAANTLSQIQFQSTPIGTVNSVSGNAVAVAADGSERVLLAGDSIYPGEIIRTTPDSAIQIAIDSGSPVTIGGGQSWVATSDTYTPNQDFDPTAAAATDVDAIQAAILAGVDPTQNAEATAAGGETPTEDGGSSFVTLERTAAEVNPEAGFDTVGLTQAITPFNEEPAFVAALTLSTPEGPDVPTDGRNTAQFTDNFVNGVEYYTYASREAYESGEDHMVTGLTGDRGEPGSFSYTPTEFIVLKIGAVTIAEFPASFINGPYLFIQDLNTEYGLEETNDWMVENIAILLQALDSDLQDSSPDEEPLETNDVLDSDAAFSTNINITPEVRAALAEYVDPRTGEPLDMQTADKRQLSDVLEEFGIVFTRVSEIDRDGASEGEILENNFETNAMEHVVGTIEDIAGSRTPGQFDSRTADVIQAEAGTIVVDPRTLEADEAGFVEFTFNAADLRGEGTVGQQVHTENMEMTLGEFDPTSGAEGAYTYSDPSNPLTEVDVILNDEVVGTVTYDADGDIGTVSIDTSKVSIDELKAGALEQIEFTYTLFDWTAYETLTAGFKGIWLADYQDVVESADYSIITLSNELSFDEDLSFTVKFAPEGAAVNFAEYSDDFRVPIEYSTDGGVAWTIMDTVGEYFYQSGSYTYDKPLPVFGFTLAASTGTGSEIQIRIPIFDDVSDEGENTFEARELIDVLIEGVDGNNTLPTTGLNVQPGIIDNDPTDVPYVDVNFAVVSEGDETAELTITLHKPDGSSAVASGDVTVTYSLVDLSATGGASSALDSGNDYVDDQATYTIPIPDGESSFVVSIPIIDDLLVEATEFSVIDLQSVVGNVVDVEQDLIIGDPQGSIRIYDNDALNVVGNRDYEGNDAVFSVTVDPEEIGAGAVITLRPTNSGASSTPNDDFDPSSLRAYTVENGSQVDIPLDQDLSFVLDGRTEFFVAYNTIHDQVLETPETVRIQVSASFPDDSGEQIDRVGLGTATIVDHPPLVSIIGPDEVMEGDTTNEYTVSLSENGVPVPTSSPVTVTIEYSGTASDGEDYTSQIEVVIPKGESGATFTLDTIDDVYADDGETIVATITEVTGGDYDSLAIDDDNSKVTTAIIDDSSPDMPEPPEADHEIVLVGVTGPVTVVEGETTTNYTVSLTNDGALVTAAEAVTVTIEYSGSATDGSDYTSFKTVTIPVGQSSATFTLDTIDDVYADNGETIIATVKEISGGSFEALEIDSESNAVTTTIIDDSNPDTPDTQDEPDQETTTITLGDVSVDEASEITYTATLNNPTATAMNVTLSNGVVIAFAAGATEGASVPQAAQGEDVYIDDESSEITIVSVAGGGFENLDLTSSAILVISDTTDTVTATLSSALADGSNEDSGSITYTMTLTGPEGLPFAPTADAGETFSFNLTDGTSVSVAVAKDATTGSTTLSWDNTAGTSDFIGALPDSDVFSDTTTVTIDGAITAINNSDYENLVTAGASNHDVLDSIDSFIVKLSADPVTVVEGSGTTPVTGTIYSVVNGVETEVTNPYAQPITVNLDNGQTITIASTASAGSVDVVVDSDDYLVDQAAIGEISVAITGVSVSSGTPEALSFEPGSVSIDIVDDQDSLYIDLSVTETEITENEAPELTYTLTLKDSLSGQPVNAQADIDLDLTLPDGSVTRVTIVTGSSSVDEVYSVSADPDAVVDPSSLNASAELVSTSADIFNLLELSASSSRNVAELGRDIDLSDLSANQSAWIHSDNATNSQLYTTSSATYMVIEDRAGTDSGEQVASPIFSLTTGAAISFSATAEHVSVGDEVGWSLFKIANTGEATEIASGGVPEFEGNIPRDYNLTMRAGDVTEITGLEAGNYRLYFEVNDNTENNETNDIVQLKVNDIEVSPSNSPYEYLEMGVSAVSTSVIDAIDTTTVEVKTSNITEDDTSVTFNFATSNAPDTGVAASLTVDVNGTEYTVDLDAAGEGSLTLNSLDNADVYNDSGSYVATISSINGGNFEATQAGQVATATVTETANNTTLTLNDVTVLEANSGTAQITASLNNAPETELVVTLSNGATITFGTDYEAGTNVSSTAFAINNDEDVYLDASSFFVSALGTSGGNFESLDTSDTATVSVTDTIQTTGISISTDPVTLTEEGGLLTYTVELGNAVRAGDDPVVVSFTDLLGNSQSITIDSDSTGGTTETFTLTIPNTDDVFADTDETEPVATNVVVDGGDNFEGLGTPTVGSFMLTDEPEGEGDAAVLTLNNNSVSEETDGKATITGSLNYSPTETLIVTLDNDATLTFGPTYVAGEAVTSTEFAINNDEDVYKDGSSFDLRVSNTNGLGGFEALDTTDTATVTVNDTTDITTLTLNDVTVSEADSGTAQITASLNNAPETELVVTLSNGATITFGPDYVANTSVSSSQFVASDGLVLSATGTTGGNYEDLDISDIANVDIDYTPFDEVDETEIVSFANRASSSGIGSLFDANLDGYGDVSFSLETSLRSGGLNVLTRELDGDVLQGYTQSAGGGETIIFELTPSLNTATKYDFEFELLAPLDSEQSLSANFADNNISGGNVGTVYIDADGSLENDLGDVSVPYVKLTSTATKSNGTVEASTINTNNNGIGVGQGLTISAGESITLSFVEDSQEGASASAISIGYGANNSGIGSTTINYQVSFVDSNGQGRGFELVNDYEFVNNNDGVGLLVLPSDFAGKENYLISEITISFESGDDFILTGITTATNSSAIPVDIEFSYTASDLDGDAVVFDAQTGDGHFSLRAEPVIHDDGTGRLVGSEYDDFIFGGSGSDTLIGGDGGDTFVWKAGDADGSIDTVTDYDSLEGDVLDLSDLLVEGTENTIEGFDNGGHLQLLVKDSSSNIIQTIELTSVSTSGNIDAANQLVTLLSNNNIDDGSV